MPNANDKRKHKPCSVCKGRFWGWSIDKKCILCRSPLEDAISMDITFNHMRGEQMNHGNQKS